MSGVVDVQAAGGPRAEVISFPVRREARLEGLSATVVVLTSDSEHLLRRSLARLRQAVSAAGAELLFVDFGSTDATREYAAANAPGARRVWLERGDRYAEALAVATSASAADVVIFVNPWVTPVSHRAIVRLLDHLALNPGAAAVAPLLDGVLAIRRTALIEVIEQPDQRLDSPPDLLLELILRGGQLHSRDGDHWRELGEGSRAAGRGITAPPRAHPMVLHVAECFAAGTERHLLDLVRHVEGFEHVLAIPSHHHGRSTQRAAALATRWGARVELVEMSRSRVPHRQGVALGALRRLIQRLDPDVVHGHSSIGGAMARMATAGLSVPLVYTPHAVSRGRWALAVERLLRARTDRTIAVSESERQFMVDHGVAEQRQVVVIPNGIDLAPLPAVDVALRSRLGIGTDTPLLGCVGRLVWQKAPEVFVSACAIVSNRLPDAHFMLIGAGPLEDVVRTAVATAGIQDRFHLIRSLPDAATVLGELDVYALPSRFEGGPYTPVEAMRAGTPVVVTDVAGSRDIVKHGVTGLTVPQDEPHALAAAMVAILEDDALRERLVRAAHADLHRFEVSSMAQATAAVYSELCLPHSAAALGELGEDLGVGAHAALP